MKVTTIENENWKDKASKFIYIERQIWKAAKFRVTRNIEWTNNSKISLFLEFGVFQIEKILKIFLFANLENSKNEELGKIS